MSAIEAVLRDPGFRNWLLDNWGFEHGLPVKNTPPTFARKSDGYFDVQAYERWLELIYADWKRLRWLN